MSTSKNHKEPQKYKSSNSKFIERTKKGRYTTEKPVIQNIKYSRIEIQEQNEHFDYTQNNEVMLFGIF